jgi:hypothetical protein
MIPIGKLSSTIITAPMSSPIIIEITSDIVESGVDCGGSDFMLLVTGNLRSALECWFNAPIFIK